MSKSIKKTLKLDKKTKQKLIKNLIKYNTFKNNFFDLNYFNKVL